MKMIFAIFLMSIMSLQAMRRIWQISPKKATSSYGLRLTSLKKDSSATLPEPVLDKQLEIKPPLFSPFTNVFKIYNEQSLWDTVKSVGPPLVLTLFSLITGIPVTVINLDSLKKPLKVMGSWLKTRNP